MSASSIVLALFGRRPLAYPIVRLWAMAYRRDASRAHWLFGELKQRAGWRAKRRVRLRNGLEMVVDPFERIGRDIATAGVFEPETVDLLTGLLKPGMTFLDIGAHVGQYSVIAVAAVGASGQVHSFEPDPQTFQYLSKNAPTAVLNNFALSDASGDAQLFLGPGSNVGTNSLRQSNNHDGRTIKVRLSTLDEYVGKSKISRLDVIKLDAEGAELSILRGGRNTLARFRPTIVTEVSALTMAGFGYAPEDFQRFLTSLNYDLFRADDGVPYDHAEPTTELQTNILAVPRKP